MEKDVVRYRSRLGHSYKNSQKSLNVEGFLAGLRFEQNGELDELPIRHQRLG